jgi:cytochrome c oxidase assembly protein subunit 15
VQVESRAFPRPRALALGLPFFRKLALASALSLYAIVISGATVRLTGSGLGCEGWPGCTEGNVFPEKDYHAFVEFGNRLVAIVPLTLTLVTWIAAWRLAAVPAWVTRVAFLVAAGTFAQAPLGLITVRLDLHPLIVMVHFLLALAVLAGAIVVALEAWRLDLGTSLTAVPRRAALAGLLLAAASLVVVVTGTLVTAAGPHAGDPDVVDRFGNIEDAIWVHVRATAVYGVLFLGLLGWLYRRRDRLRLPFVAALALLGVLVVQMAVGEIQWRNALPWWLVLVHVGLAAAVWSATVVLASLLWRARATGN